MYPSLFENHYGQIDFEAVMEAFSQFSVFNLPVLDGLKKHSHESRNYYRLFFHMRSYICDNFKGNATTQEITEVIYRKLNSGSLSEYYSSKMVLFPTMDNLSVREIGFIEKLVSNTLQALEPVTFLDMLRVAAKLRKFNENVAIGVFNLSNFPEKKEHLTAIKGQYQALIINVNRNIEEPAKWVIVRLQDFSGKGLPEPEFYSESALLEAEKNALQIKLDVNFNDLTQGKSSCNEASGYTAIAWLMSRYQPEEYNPNADFISLLVQFIDCQFVEQQFDFPEGNEKRSTGNLRRIMQADFHGHGYAENIKKIDNHISYFVLSYLCRQLALPHIDGQALQFSLANVVKVWVQDRPTKKLYKRFFKYFTEACRADLFITTDFLQTEQAKRLVTITADRASLLIPDNFAEIDFNEFTVEKPLHKQNYFKQLGKKSFHPHNIASGLLLNIFRYFHIARIAIIWPRSYVLNEADREFILHLMTKNPRLQQVEVNTNPALQELKQQLTPTICRNRWLAWNNYISSVFDNYWQCAVKYYFIYLAQRQNIMTEPEKQEEFKQIVRGMGRELFESLVNFMQAADFSLWFNNLATEHNLVFYLPSNGFITLINKHLKIGGIFPFSELEIDWQISENDALLTLLSLLKEYSIEKITLQVGEASPEEVEQLLKDVSHYALANTCTLIIAIPTLKQLGVQPQWHAVSVQYQQLNNTISRNLNTKIAEPLVAALRESNDASSVELSQNEEEGGQFWLLHEGDEVGLQMQNQNQLVLDKNKQTTIQQGDIPIREALVLGELVTYDTIDKLYEHRVAPHLKHYALLQQEGETLLQGLFHTWSNCPPESNERFLINAMTQSAVDELLRYPERATSGFNLANLPKGFYVQPNPQGGLILCFDPALGYLNQPTPLTVIMTVTRPRAEKWLSDFTMLNPQAYVTSHRLTQDDFNLLAVFAKLQPAEETRGNKQDLKDFCHYQKEEQWVQCLRANAEYILHNWLVFKQIWQVFGKEGIDVFLQEKHDFTRAPSQVMAFLFPDISKVPFVPSDANVIAVGQIYCRYGAKPFLELVEKFKAIKKGLGHVFFERFFDKVLGRSANFCSYLTPTFFQAMNEMIAYFTKNPRVAREAWLTLCEKHLAVVGWEQPEKLWYAFAYFSQQMQKMQLFWDTNYFADLKPQNMLVTLDRVIACLQKLPNPADRKKFLLKLSKLDLRAGGIHYVLHYGNKAQLKALGFRQSSRVTLPRDANASDEPVRRLDNEDNIDLSAFEEYQQRLEYFLRHHVVISVNSEVIYALEPLLEFFKQIQGNPNSYLNELGVLLAILEKTEVDRFWPVDYLTQMLKALSIDHQVYRCNILADVINTPFFAARPFNAKARQFPPVLSDLLQRIIANVACSSAQHSKLCQIALREYYANSATPFVISLLELLAKQIANPGYLINIFDDVVDISQAHQTVALLAEILKVGFEDLLIERYWKKTLNMLLKWKLFEYDSIKTVLLNNNEFVKRRLLHILIWSNAVSSLDSEDMPWNEDSSQVVLQQLLKPSSNDKGQIKKLVTYYPKRPAPNITVLQRALRKEPEAIDVFLKQPFSTLRKDYKNLSILRQLDFRRMLAEVRVIYEGKQSPLTPEQIVHISMAFMELKALEAGDEFIKNAKNPVAEMSQQQLCQAYKELGQILQNDPNESSVKVQLWAVLFEVIARTTQKYPHMAQQFALLANDTCSSSRNRVLRLATGAGKSHYNALNAARYVSLGRTVDIFTIKRSLAQRDHADYEAFFAYLGIKSAYILPNSLPQEYLDTNVHYSTLGDYSLFFDEQQVTNTAIAVKAVALGDEIDDPLFLNPTIQYNYAVSANVSPRERIWFYQEINLFYIRFLVGEPKIYANTHIKTLIKILRSKAGHNPERLAYVDHLARNSLELIGWLRAASCAQKREPDIDYTLVEDNILRNGNLYPMQEIIPLSKDNQKLEGASFSNGVHQLLAVRLNQEAERQHQPQNYHVHAESNILSSQVASYNLRLYEHWEGLTGTVSSAQAKYLSLYNAEVLHIPPNQKEKRVWHKPSFYGSEKERAFGFYTTLTHVLAQKRSVLIACRNDKEVLKIQEILNNRLTANQLAAVIFYVNTDKETSKQILDRKKQLEQWQNGKKGQGVTLVSAVFGRGDNVNVEAVFVFDATDENDLVQKGGRTARNGEFGEVFQFYLAQDLKDEKQQLLALLHKNPNSRHIAIDLQQREGESEEEACVRHVLLLREQVFLVQHVARQGYQEGLAQFTRWTTKLRQQFPAERLPEFNHYLVGLLQRLEKQWFTLACQDYVTAATQVATIEEAFLNAVRVIAEDWRHKATQWLDFQFKPFTIFIPDVSDNDQESSSQHLPLIDLVAQLVSLKCKADERKELEGLLMQYSSEVINKLLISMPFIHSLSDFKEQAQHPQQISLPEGGKRPLFSQIITTYNEADEEKKTLLLSAVELSNNMAKQKKVLFLDNVIVLLKNINTSKEKEGLKILLAKMGEASQSEQIRQQQLLDLFEQLVIDNQINSRLLRILSKVGKRGYLSEIVSYIVNNCDLPEIKNPLLPEVLEIFFVYCDGGEMILNWKKLLPNQRTLLMRLLYKQDLLSPNWDEEQNSQQLELGLLHYKHEMEELLQPSEALPSAKKGLSAKQQLGLFSIAEEMRAIGMQELSTIKQSDLDALQKELQGCTQQYSVSWFMSHSRGQQLCELNKKLDALKDNCYKDILTMIQQTRQNVMDSDNLLNQSWFRVLFWKHNSSGHSRFLDILNEMEARIIENWCKDPTSLSSFTSYFEDCKAVYLRLIQQLIEAFNGKGIEELQQSLNTIITKGMNNLTSADIKQLEQCFEENFANLAGELQTIAYEIIIRSEALKVYLQPINNQAINDEKEVDSLVGYTPVV